MLAIDLSVSRPSGIAFFEDKKIRTLMLENEKILKFASNFDRVAIDAPLSLPFGRSSIDERNSRHFRECDLMLRKMHIKFFPITLGAMRKLTKLGMELAEELKAMGIKVYEIFPGASYDVLGIKRGSIKEVNDFLGYYKAKANTRDEADAAMGLFTLYLYEKGHGYELKGRDGSIIIPKPAIYMGTVKKAKFLERINRFVVRSGLGEVYLRDTARLNHLLQKGVTLFLSRNNGKFKYRINSVFHRDYGRVMLDSFLDERMVGLWLRFNGVIPKRCEKRNNIIFDWCFDDKVVEVKGAHLFNGDCVMFPDGFSERAVKHFYEIARYREKGFLVFVSHSKAPCFRINEEYDKVKKAFLYAIDRCIKFTALSTEFFDDYWIFDREIEVIVD